MKKIIIKIIKIILWCIDKDHRKNEEISENNFKKFTHTQDVNFNSDFASANKIFRTIPYDCWELKTRSFTIHAADKHLFVKKDSTLVWLKDLEKGDKIKTKNGIEKVKSVKNLNIKVHFYDVEINSKDHLYYTNNILSHNTTCAASFILWYAMFQEDKSVLLVSNKESAAIEIMDRIKYGYEELPDFLRAGVTKYNVKTIEFDNGSRIITRATSTDSARGLSISLLYCIGGENTITVKNKETNKIETIPIEKFYEELL